LIRLFIFQPRKTRTRAAKKQTLKVPSPALSTSETDDVSHQQDDDSSAADSAADISVKDFSPSPVKQSKSRTNPNLARPLDIEFAEVQRDWRSAGGIDY